MAKVGCAKASVCTVAGDSPTIDRCGRCDGRARCSGGTPRMVTIEACRSRTLCRSGSFLLNWYTQPPYTTCSSCIPQPDRLFDHDSSRKFPTFVFANLCRSCGDNTPHAWVAAGAIGKSRQTTGGLCRNLQFSTPRCIANPGRP